MRRKKPDYAPPSFVSRPPAHSEASAPVPRPPSRRRSGPTPAMPLRGEPDSRHYPTEGGSRPGTPVLRPRRAAKRLRPSHVPPSREKSRKGPEPLPGFRRRWRRKEVESFFPAACTPGKIPLTERRVDEGPPPTGAGPHPRQSGVRRPMRRPVSARAAQGFLAQMFLGTFARNYLALYTAFMAL